MRFLSIYRTKERSTSPSIEVIAKMGKLMEDGTKTGCLAAAEGCLPIALGATVRSSKGDVAVVGGTVATNEVIGGFAIFRVEDKKEAIRLAKEFLEVAGDGECELRQLYDAPPVPPASLKD
jgi:hypothetical protein